MLQQPLTPATSTDGSAARTVSLPDERQGDYVGQALAALRVESRTRWRRRALASIAIVFAFAFVSLAVLHLHSAPGLVYLVVGVGATAAAATRRQKRLTRSLAGCDDVRAIPAFLDALAFRDRELRDLSLEQLALLLPRVQASDAGLFTTHHRRVLDMLLRGSIPGFDAGPLSFTGRTIERDLTGGRLDASRGSVRLLLPEIVLSGVRRRTRLNVRRSIGRRRDDRVALAALAALAQVGDESDLAAISLVADRTEDPELRDAAEACRELIEAGAARRRAGSTLLRASAQPADAADTLLRAATADAGTPADELLRGADPAAGA